MRLDSINTPPAAITGNTARPASERSPAMSEGDIISARVLSTGDGTASLRASDGTLLQAQLENGIVLTPGTDVYLSVQNSSGEITVLSPVIPGAEAASQTQQIAADPLLNAIFDQLVSLGYSPTEENMSAMKQLISQMPHMSMQEAAFFAAQKAEPSLLEAFRGIVTGENDTAALLDKLAAATSTPAEGAAATPAQTGEAVSATTTPAPGSAQNSAAPPDMAPGAQIPVVITDKAVISAPATEAPPEVHLQLQAQPQSEAMQSQPQIQAEIQVQAQPQPQSEVQTLPQPEAVLSQPETQPQQTAQSGQAAQPGAGASALPVSEPSLSPPEFGRWLQNVLGTAGANTDPASAPVFTGEVLAGSPLLEGLSVRSLSGIADSLNRIAEGMPKSSSETELFENISKFAKELFVRLDGDDEKIQDRLKEVREELYIKLAYFRDTVASSGSSSKAFVLEQTEKLMDHLRLLNGLDQFVCVQLPVQLGDQQRNAELYIYKKEKNGVSRIDPENVKILLALDLIHMGRLETMIEIQGRDVSLRFEAENDNVAGALKQSTAKIHRLLADTGYKFANSTVVTKQKTTTVETALLSLIEVERSRGGMDMII